MERVTLEAAFVLHGRAYRETSTLLDLFARDHGLVGLVARGTRRAGNALRATLQPFRPVLASWSGRGGGLMTLTAAEPAGRQPALQGTALMSAFYMNELLLRFLHRGDPHPQLFAAYATALERLAGSATAEPVLRGFELELLAESGYGLILDHDAAGAELEPGRPYQYLVERGPVPADGTAQAGESFTGGQLIAIREARFDDPQCLADARRLLRAVLDHHLGGRPLRTREVFAAMRR